MIHKSKTQKGVKKQQKIVFNCFLCKQYICDDYLSLVFAVLECIALRINIMRT